MTPFHSDIAVLVWRLLYFIIGLSLYILLLSEIQEGAGEKVKKIYFPNMEKLKINKNLKKKLENQDTSIFMLTHQCDTFNILYGFDFIHTFCYLGIPQKVCVSDL